MIKIYNVLATMSDIILAFIFIFSTIPIIVILLYDYYIKYPKRNIIYTFK